MAQANTLDRPPSPTQPRLTTWTARRSGAHITLEGVDAMGRRHVITGITQISGNAVGQTVAIDSASRAIELA